MIDEKLSIHWQHSYINWLLWQHFDYSQLSMAVLVNGDYFHQYTDYFGQCWVNEDYSRQYWSMGIVLISTDYSDQWGLFSSVLFNVVNGDYSHRCWLTLSMGTILVSTDQWCQWGLLSSVLTVLVNEDYSPQYWLFWSTKIALVSTCYPHQPWSMWPVPVIFTSLIYRGHSGWW